MHVKKLPPSKLITEMLRFSFIPGLGFFFSFFQAHYHTLLLPEKQWKRIKTEPQHRHEKMSNNLSDRKKTLRQFFDPLGL